MCLCICNLLSCRNERPSIRKHRYRTETPGRADTAWLLLLVDVRCISSRLKEPQLNGDKCPCWDIYLRFSTGSHVGGWGQRSREPRLIKGARAGDQIVGGSSRKLQCCPWVRTRASSGRIGSYGNSVTGSREQGSETIRRAHNRFPPRIPETRPSSQQWQNSRLGVFLHANISCWAS